MAGVDLSTEWFSQGQLYVASFRVGNAQNVFILTPDCLTRIRVTYIKKFYYNFNRASGINHIENKKYHVFAPMGRFQLESIYLYFPPSSQLLYLCFCRVGFSLL